MKTNPFKKFIAILNVIAWAGFWAFGYLALTAETQNIEQITTAFVLAALGGMIGIWAYLQLVRYAEASGYAQPPQTADRSHLEAEFLASEGNN